MNNCSNSQIDKNKRLIEIKEILHKFCANYLNKELEEYAIKLCDKLGRKRTINVLLGKKEIWAASIIHVISRLNFLFDKENERYITADTICNFFNAKKSTIGNKANQIEKSCNLTIGAKGYCSKQITDSFSFVQTQEGFIIPKNMIEEQEWFAAAAEGEAAKEVEEFLENKRIIREQKIKGRKERRTEINRKIAEKKKSADDKQLRLFDNL